MTKYDIVLRAIELISPRPSSDNLHILHKIYIKSGIDCCSERTSAQYRTKAEQTIISIIIYKQS